MKQFLSYFQQRARSFVYAFRGIGFLFKTQANARIHLLAILLVSLLSAWLGISAAEWCLVLLCMALVLSAEAINSALESLTDLASPDFHPLAGRAKDLAAGAVLISAIFSALVWGIIHLPKLWALWVAWTAPTA